MSDALPDALAFAARALAARGALVEPTPAGASALLPPDLAAALALPEEVTLAAQPEEGSAAIACGVGAPLVERLAADARRATPWVALEPAVAPPRGTHAASLAARVTVRNGVADVGEARAGEAVYVRAWVAWSVEADDRYEGLVHLAASSDGGEPDAHVAALLDVAATEDAPPPAATPVDGAALRAALAALAPRASIALTTAAEEAFASIERRHARDHARMTAYFDGLVAELGAGRRKVDAATLAARAATVAAERDARLRDLVVRYTPRVATAPVALACAALPVVRVALRVRRRKLDRTLWVALPAGAQALDLLACEGCGGVTARPAVCDDRLHALCERCVPQAAGRFDCPACARR